MSRRRPFLCFLAFSFNLALLVAILLSAVDWAAFSRAFYAEQYQRLNTAESIGLSQEDLEASTEKLLDYIQAKAPDLSVKVRLDESPESLTEMFNQREIDHMWDVRLLYLNSMKIRNLLFTIAFIALIAMLFLLRKEKRSSQDFRCLQAAFGLSLAFFIFLLAGIAIFAALDFTSFWTAFHKLVFSNDLWILNPATDRLIMMVPEPFFAALVKKIIITALLTLIAYNHVLFILVSLLKRKELKTVKALEEI